MTEIELQLLTDIAMLLMVEKGIRDWIRHAIHRYATVNNKFMKNYSNEKESPDIMYWDANKLYGWAFSQKLPATNFELKKLHRR